MTLTDKLFKTLPTVNGKIKYLLKEGYGVTVTNYGWEEDIIYENENPHTNAYKCMVALQGKKGMKRKGFILKDFFYVFKTPLEFGHLLQERLHELREEGEKESGMKRYEEKIRKKIKRLSH